MIRIISVWSWQDQLVYQTELQHQVYYIGSLHMIKSKMIGMIWGRSKWKQKYLSWSKCTMIFKNKGLIQIWLI